ncbi:MAG: helix-turn-helix domain-containing protein [Actinomycetota bacterium]|nr:helix-turn-helix domain-containing protein [Actinomycetota bacterium]MDA8076514.1 helix-turn-helix domain-containing protein [Actinomycetota bacterium]MDA8366717.1 helix-turn-helix domain-containing protein [Actinomycetota bacterium]
MTRSTTALRRSIERAAEASMDRFVTQREAAELAGCSKDTIVRTRQAGRLPHARLDGHTWMIPIADLVVAGLYDPATGAMPDAPPRAREEPEHPGAVPTSMELARAQARIAALEDLVARQDAELAFLRQLATDTLAKKAS